MLEKKWLIKKLNVGCFWNYEKDKDGNNLMSYSQFTKNENNVRKNIYANNFHDFPLTTLIIKNDLYCSEGSIKFSLKLKGKLDLICINI